MCKDCTKRQGECKGAQHKSGLFSKNAGNSWTVLWLTESQGNAISPVAKVLTFRGDSPITTSEQVCTVLAGCIQKPPAGWGGGAQHLAGQCTTCDLSREENSISFYSWEFHDVAFNSNLAMPPHPASFSYPTIITLKWIFTLESDLAELKLVVIKAP